MGGCYTSHKNQEQNTNTPKVVVYEEEEAEIADIEEKIFQFQKPLAHTIKPNLVVPKSKLVKIEKKANKFHKYNLSLEIVTMEINKSHINKNYSRFNPILEISMREKVQKITHFTSKSNLKSSKSSKMKLMKFFL